MSDIKFRQLVGGNWHYWGYIDGCFVGPITNQQRNPVNCQLTGLRDVNGVEIYEGDLVNIYFTSSDGEYIHDCIYKAEIGELGDLQFRFTKLLWVDSGHNQYPSSIILCLRYNNLDYEYSESGAVKLKMPDSWGENNFHRTRWKQEDKSFYFEIIGNIYEHPHLLDGAK